MEKFMVANQNKDEFVTVLRKILANVKEAGYAAEETQDDDTWKIEIPDELYKDFLDEDRRKLFSLSIH